MSDFVVSQHFVWRDAIVTVDQVQCARVHFARNLSPPQSLHSLVGQFQDSTHLPFAEPEFSAQRFQISAKVILNVSRCVTSSIW